MSDKNRALSVDDITRNKEELVKIVRRLASILETKAISLDVN